MGKCVLCEICYTIADFHQVVKEPPDGSSLCWIWLVNPFLPGKLIPMQLRGPQLDISLFLFFVRNDTRSRSEISGAGQSGSGPCPTSYSLPVESTTKTGNPTYFH